MRIRKPMIMITASRKHWCSINVLPAVVTGIRRTMATLNPLLNKPTPNSATYMYGIISLYVDLSSDTQLYLFELSKHEICLHVFRYSVVLSFSDITRYSNQQPFHQTRHLNSYPSCLTQVYRSYYVCCRCCWFLVSSLRSIFLTSVLEVSNYEQVVIITHVIVYVRSYLGVVYLLILTTHTCKCLCKGATVC